MKCDQLRNGDWELKSALIRTSIPCECSQHREIRDPSSGALMILFDLACDLRVNISSEPTPVLFWMSAHLRSAIVGSTWRHRFHRPFHFLYLFLYLFLSMANFFPKEKLSSLYTIQTSVSFSYADLNYSIFFRNYETV